MEIMQIILAQANVPLGPNGEPIPVPPQPGPSPFLREFPTNDIWRIVSGIGWIEALICLVLASIYLLYGWRLFRILVFVNVAMIGLIIGRKFGARVSLELWGGVLGVIVGGLISLPLMKYFVAVLGALAGALLGLMLWRAGSLPEPLWAGALAGLITGGLLAFSSFKFSIILFSSVLGSVFFTLGTLALLNAYPNPNMSGHLNEMIFGRVFVLPAMVIAPTTIGVLLQLKLLKLQEKWAMPDNEGWKRK